MNQAAIDIVKRFEGCRLNAYLDAVGIPTIGFGHCHGVKMGDTITQEEADELLHGDLLIAESAVNRLVKVYINENEKAALTSFVFNLGEGNLAKSTMLKLLNQMRYDLAASEFPKWVKAGGVVLQGLVKRREAERQLFLEPI